MSKAGNHDDGLITNNFLYDAVGLLHHVRLFLGLRVFPVSRSVVSSYSSESHMIDYTMAI
jgi:hypothetical protein